MVEVDDDTPPQPVSADLDADSSEDINGSDEAAESDAAGTNGHVDNRSVQEAREELHLRRRLEGPASLILWIRASDIFNL